LPHSSPSSSCPPHCLSSPQTLAYAITSATLKPGKNTVKATTKTKAGETVTDALEWELVPAK
jgi:hypothetical protein